MTTKVIEDSAQRPISPPDEWLKLSADLTRALRQVIRRRDVLVRAAPGAGHGAPACFIHPWAAIELNGDDLGVDPQTANPLSREDRKRYPHFWGATLHEGAHAQHTKWTKDVDEDSVSAAALNCALLLEESRIEHRLISSRRSRSSQTDLGTWLDAMVAHYVLPNHQAAIMNFGMGISAAALLLARADAGSFRRYHSPLKLRVSEALTPLVLSQLAAIWQEAHQTADDDTEKMLELGKSWARLARETSKKSARGILGTKQKRALFPPPLGSPKWSSGVEAAVEEESGKPLTSRDVRPTGTRKEQRAAEKEARDAVDQATEDAKGAAGKHGAGASSSWSGGVTGWRPPAAEERVAAQRLTKELQRAMIRERGMVVVTSQLPPGRVVPRQAMIGSIERAVKGVSTAEPFKRVTRRSSPQPPFRLGGALDVSGSMADEVGPVASAGWVAARAVSPIPDSQTALVTFADHQVHPVLFPRNHFDQVPVLKETHAGFEPLSKAIDVLDGLLGLTQPGAARLLLIVSDDVLTIVGEGARAVQRAQRLIRSDCRILWLTPKSPGYYKGNTKWAPYLNTVPGIRAVHIPSKEMATRIPEIVLQEAVKVMKGG